MLRAGRWHRFARGVGWMLLVFVGGCHGFAPATSETLQRIRAMALAQQLPSERFVLEIESAHLAGVFDVLCSSEPGALRFLLFPDVGGKVMDVRASPTEITAILADQTYRAVAPLDQAEPHLALLLAAMLIELRADVGKDRVMGERRSAAGQVAVQLRPALQAGTVIAELAADGCIASYQITLGWLQFTLLADGSFVGRGFTGKLCP
jgi:hypothetical protein